MDAFLLSLQMRELAFDLGEVTVEAEDSVAAFFAR
jgi:hypothetical protein